MPPTAYAPVHMAVEAERRIVPWARGALLALVVAAVAAGVVAVSYAPTLHRELDYLGRAWDAGQSGTTLPTPPTVPAGYSLLSDLIGAVLLGTDIVLLIWQFRAASAARLLGLPARRSPGWGVGSWFIPVVNLWLPYQAICDCLPSGHPGRRRVLRFWLALVAAECCSTAVPFTAAFSRLAGVVLLAGAAGIWLLVALSLHAVMRDVAVAHGAVGSS
ncbi:MAG: DUF4328 domain-containing protein [Acidimicrobiales bacterium]